MTGSEIDGYVSSGEWRGKAGAYALQETADRFIRDISGSFSNVVGLPIELVTRMIDELRQRPKAHKTT
jgi:septum formation protein